MTLPKDLSVQARRWCRLWRVEALLDEIVFCQNARLRTTVARWVQKSHCVELGPRFKLLRKRQAEVLCHELAHAAAIHRYGSRIAPHGPQWRQLVRVAGFAPGTRLGVPSFSLPRVTVGIAYFHSQQASKRLIFRTFLMANLGRSTPIRFKELRSQNSSCDPSFLASQLTDFQRENRSQRRDQETDQNPPVT